jgi:hypothetical protein
MAGAGRLPSLSMDAGRHRTPIVVLAHLVQIGRATSKHLLLTLMRLRLTFTPTDAAAYGHLSFSHYEYKLTHANYGKLR